MARHLTLEERDRISQLLHQGADQKEIAKALKRCPSTISRELRRNETDDNYYAGQAQRQAKCRRSERPLSRKMDDQELNEIVRHGLTHDWAPEQIAGRLKEEHPDDPQRHVSPQTIYTWIEQDENREHWQSFLRRRGKRPYRRKNTTETGAGARIHDRPEVIEQRLRLGDFEGDTVLGPAGTGGLATLVDRKSRYTIIVKVQSKDADHVHQKIKERLRELDDEHRRSITFDNGTEFARCHRLESHLGMELYFADPGCPYQRGTNENTNGLIRQYFPKGTDFRDVSHYEVRRVENRLNNRPRECLGFKTPAEVFFENHRQENCD
jgi:transposase, IS30 family